MCVFFTWDGAKLAVSIVRSCYSKPISPAADSSFLFYAYVSGIDLLIVIILLFLSQ